MFRSGSTYVFDKFRRAGGFTCYQEPFNEELIELNFKPEKLLKPPCANSIDLRHPALNSPYFHEYYCAREYLRNKFFKAFSYSQYFTGPSLPELQKAYIAALIDIASARPLLQFCRSSGRIQALKTTFGGVHIHLWRDPQSQW